MTSTRGKLIVLPVANRPAAESAVRSPYHLQDLELRFPGRKTGTDTEQLAAAIIGLVARYRPAVVLDLTSRRGRRPRRARSREYLILSEEGRAAEMALDVLEALNPTRGDQPFSYLRERPRAASTGRCRAASASRSSRSRLPGAPRCHAGSTRRSTS